MRTAARTRNDTVTDTGQRKNVAGIQSGGPAKIATETGTEEKTRTANEIERIAAGIGIGIGTETGTGRGGPAALTALALGTSLDEARLGNVATALGQETEIAAGTRTEVSAEDHPGLFALSVNAPVDITVPMIYIADALCLISSFGYTTATLVSLCSVQQR